MGTNVEKWLVTLPSTIKGYIYSKWTVFKSHVRICLQPLTMSCNAIVFVCHFHVLSFSFHRNYLMFLWNWEVNQVSVPNWMEVNKIFKNLPVITSHVLCVKKQLWMAQEGLFRNINKSAPQKIGWLQSHSLPECQRIFPASHIVLPVKRLTC